MVLRAALSLAYTTYPAHVHAQRTAYAFSRRASHVSDLFYRERPAGVPGARPHRLQHATHHHLPEADEVTVYERQRAGRPGVCLYTLFFVVVNVGGAGQGLPNCHSEPSGECVRGPLSANEILDSIGDCKTRKRRPRFPYFRVKGAAETFSSP